MDFKHQNAPDSGKALLFLVSRKYPEHPEIPDVPLPVFRKSGEASNGGGIEGKKEDKHVLLDATADRDPDPILVEIAVIAFLVYSSRDLRKIRIGLFYISGESGIPENPDPWAF